MSMDSISNLLKREKIGVWSLIVFFSSFQSFQIKFNFLPNAIHQTYNENVIGCWLLVVGLTVKLTSFVFNQKQNFGRLVWQQVSRPLKKKKWNKIEPCRRYVPFLSCWINRENGVLFKFVPPQNNNVVKYNLLKNKERIEKKLTRTHTSTRLVLKLHVEDNVFGDFMHMCVGICVWLSSTMSMAMLGVVVDCRDNVLYLLYDLYAEAWASSMWWLYAYQYTHYTLFAFH